MRSTPYKACSPRARIPCPALPCPALPLRENLQNKVLSRSPVFDGSNVIEALRGSAIALHVLSEIGDVREGHLELSEGVVARVVVLTCDGDLAQVE